MWKGALLILAFAVAANAAEDRPLFKWEQPRPYEIAALVLAEASIWIDVSQTLDWTSKGQPGHETNLFLGRHPSRGRVFWTGGVLPSVLLAGLWYAMPAGWRVVPCGAVLGAELSVILDNSLYGLTIHF